MRNLQSLRDTGGASFGLKRANDEGLTQAWAMLRFDKVGRTPDRWLLFLHCRWRGGNPVKNFAIIMKNSHIYLEN